MHAGAVTVLWSAIEFDFILLMLHKSQPLSQIIMTLHLLATSVLPNSFGAIVVSTTSRHDQPTRQTKSETDILDRLTVLLFEVPESKSTTSPAKPSPFNDNNIFFFIIRIRDSFTPTEPLAASPASSTPRPTPSTNTIHRPMTSPPASSTNPS